MNRILPRFSAKWLLAFIVAILVAMGAQHFAAEARRKAEPTARPALWMVSDADTRIYLFGTIHFLPKGLAWRSETLESAIAGSDSLVLEVAGLDDQQKTYAALVKYAMATGLPPVVERVPADRRARLEKMAADAGVSFGMLNNFENWAVAITLAVGSLKEIGLSPEEGAEEQLRRTFAAAKKPIAGLETADEQFSFFDSMSADAQNTLLISTVDEGGNARAEFDKMLGAWKRGDEKKIALSFDDELKMSPELVDKLLRKRNANWAAWIDERMDQPGTIFMAVGAGHLAGRDSVQKMLKQRGFRVKRIQ